MDFLHYFLPDFSRGIPPEAGLTYAWFWIIPLVASGISAIAQARAQKKEREANRELA